MPKYFKGHFWIVEQNESKTLATEFYIDKSSTEVKTTDIGSFLVDIYIEHMHDRTNIWQETITRDWIAVRKCIRSTITKPLEIDALNLCYDFLGIILQDCQEVAGIWRKPL